MTRKFTVFLLCALLLLSATGHAAAQEPEGNQKGSIRITLVAQNDQQPVAGAAFDVYRVADATVYPDNSISYDYAGDFALCGILMDDSQLTEKLSAYANENASPDRQIVTDTKGTAVCGDLPQGLYLLKQEETAEGISACSPFLISIPTRNEQKLIYDVDASPKTDVTRWVSVTVKVVWNAGNAAKIPESVMVQLLRSGKVVKTAVLTQADNWEITYPFMLLSDSYEIRELNVPQGFTATYSQNGLVFIVTNTADMVQNGQIVVDNNGNLAQTGLLMWPIPVLAAAGLLLLLLGFALLRKPGKTNA